MLNRVPLRPSSVRTSNSKLAYFSTSSAIADQSRSESDHSTRPSGQHITRKRREKVASRNAYWSRTAAGESSRLAIGERLIHNLKPFAVEQIQIEEVMCAPVGLCKLPNLNYQNNIKSAQKNKKEFNFSISSI